MDILTQMDISKCGTFLWLQTRVGQKARAGQPRLGPALTYEGLDKGPRKKPGQSLSPLLLKK